MTGTADKAMRLLRLAANPGASDEEARTSAVIAARLIMKEGLSVRAGAGAEDMTDMFLRQARESRRYSEGYRDGYDAGRRAASAESVRQSRVAASAAPPAPAPDPGPQQRRIRTKFPASCRGCGVRIAVGVEVVWRRVDGQSGVAHVECVTKAGWA